MASKTKTPAAAAAVAPDQHILDELFATVKRRRRASPEQSYTARLFSRGRPQIAKKLGEEAVEVVVAALAQDKKVLISESGDLFFHLLVLWAEAGVKPDQVWKELERRFGISGIAEKQSRGGAPAPAKP
jgi:phosphoribosyl-ATP pyrophosphohydrolase